MLQHGWQDEVRVLIVTSPRMRPHGTRPAIGRFVCSREASSPTGRAAESDRRDAAVREAAATWFRHQLAGDEVTARPRDPEWEARALPGGRMARMKIGITCYPTYGGSGAVATELGIALAQRGHEIHFITYQQPFRLPRSCRASTSTRWTSAGIRCSSTRRTTSRWRCACTRWCCAHSSTSCTCTTRSRTRRARGSRARCSRRRARHQGGHDAARHRHHHRRPGSVVPRHHQVLDREVGRPHRGLAVPRDGDAVARSAARRAASR